MSPHISDWYRAVSAGHEWMPGGGDGGDSEVGGAKVVGHGYACQTKLVLAMGGGLN